MNLETGIQEIKELVKKYQNGEISLEVFGQERKAIENGHAQNLYSQWRKTADAVTSRVQRQNDEAEKELMTKINGGVCPPEYCGHLNPSRFSICKAPSCLNPKCVEPKF
ncbi:MAG: hypothetical protein FWC00_00305 [Firmicutes bacterium]|nr:hypothetical protein [Bacillota bacterium]